MCFSTNSVRLWNFFRPYLALTPLGPLILSRKVQQRLYSWNCAKLPVTYLKQQYFYLADSSWIILSSYDIANLIEDIGEKKNTWIPMFNPSKRPSKLATAGRARTLDQARRFVFRSRSTW